MRVRVRVRFRAKVYRGIDSFFNLGRVDSSVRGIICLPGLNRVN